MGTEDWISAISAALFLALGALCLVRGARNPLAPPLALLCFAFFLYDTLEVVRSFTDEPLWDWLDRAVAALVGPPTLWLVATFAGMRRTLRWPLLAASAYFVGLALVCVLAIPFPTLRWLPGSDLWALWMLAGMVPTFGAIPFVLARHARRAGTEERARTQLFGLALLLGVGGVASELVAIAGAAAPRVAAIGIVVSVLLLGALVLRARVLTRLTGLSVLSAIALATLAVVGHVMVLEWLGESTVLVVFGAVALSLMLLAALRPFQILLTEERERARHLATLGRFSVQMAHDLKNPLAAIKGAAQFLAEESERGRSIDGQKEFVSLIIEQADRLGRVVESYQRLGRVEAICATVDVGKLVREVGAAQRAAARGEGVDVVTDVRAAIEMQLDRDLILGALENLVRNARDAMAERGRGRIALVLEPRGDDVCIRVEDDGPGMDARTRERAFDEFYTTKATGSGLGLALVSRVARAHGGRAAIESEEGKGTVVEITLPRSRPSLTPPLAG